MEALENLVDSLRKIKDLGEKQELLLGLPKVGAFLSDKGIKPFLPQAPDLSSKIALYSILAIEQNQILFTDPNNPPSKEKIKNLLSVLVSIDRFFESIGGIIGYHLQVLKLLAKDKEPRVASKAAFSRAPGIDLTASSEQVNQAIWSGIQALDELAEIYPIGGLGTRLKLFNKKQKPQPVACLSFCGRTLLEGLVRDVQSREFIFYRLFNRQVTVPIAMMTSLEKQNAIRIETICKNRGWFGRPKESFLLFSQLSVPVVTYKGKWSMKAPLEINLQPGGHGALWKAAEECGVFFWLQSQEKNHLIIRQINNPIAGLDFGLLTLLGIGKTDKKTFGFASCERLPHAAEGVLVLIEEEGIRRLSNIEYTDFKAYGIEDFPTPEGYSLYPANTNILYANLQKILPVIKKNPLPGLIINMKSKEPFLCSAGTKTEEIGGRLESMMQNISDGLKSGLNEPLPSFLTYNVRRKTISVAKKSFNSDQQLLETPEGAFYDLLYNAHDLLKNYCRGILDPFCTQVEYLQNGPSHLFLYHPALGPLYSLIAQKIKNPSLAVFSEMQCEIADLFLENLNLDGSLLIFAKNIMGHDSQGIIRYSQKTGKCILKDVKVNNKGINRKKTLCYWKNLIKRQEALTIILQGQSEFYAEGINFKGNQKIVVPAGERWIAKQGNDGQISYHIEKPTWQWEYKEDSKQIKLVIH